MQFDLDEDRALLKQSTRELLEREAPLAESRGVMEDSAEGFSKALYTRMGELGYVGLCLPEAQGGSGAGRVGLAAVLEEMGRVAFPGPFLDLVVAAEVLRSCADDAARAWRDQLLTGEARVLIADRESVTGDEPAQPEVRFEDGRVRGVKRFVPFGAEADALIVSTRRGLALAPRPDAGWGATPLPTLDFAQRFVEVELDAEASPLADADEAGPLLRAASQLGALGASALLLGLMQRSLELTTAYTSERQAFGQPIAGFQALAHRQADMLLRTEATRAAVYRAAWAADAEPERAPFLVAVAKAYAGDAARFVCGEAIQLFGGVGFTWEYDPHILFKRAETLALFYGATRDQLELALEASGL